MNIRTKPYDLNILNKNIIHCPCCNDILIKKIKMGSYLVDECGYCRYSDRPFTMRSSSLQSHYPDGCQCRYEEKQFIYIEIVELRINSTIR
jgi:hypothetical protein